MPLGICSELEWISETKKDSGHLCRLQASVRQGRYTRTPQAGWLTNNTHLLLTVLKTTSPRSRHQQIPCLVRTHSLVHRDSRLLTVSSCARRGEGAFWGLIRALIPSVRALPSWPSQLAPPPNTITFGVWDSICESGKGHKFIQCLARSKSVRRERGKADVPSSPGLAVVQPPWRKKRGTGLSQPHPPVSWLEALEGCVCVCVSVHMFVHLLTTPPLLGMEIPCTHGHNRHVQNENPQSPASLHDLMD